MSRLKYNILYLSECSAYDIWKFKVLVLIPHTQNPDYFKKISFPSTLKKGQIRGKQNR